MIPAEDGRRDESSFTHRMKSVWRRSIWILLDPFDSSVTTSAKGGIDITAPPHTVHAPKYSSVYQPPVPMALFAPSMSEDASACLKSMVPKSSFNTAKRLPSSALQNVCQLGWNSANPESESPNAPTVSESNPWQRFLGGKELASLVPLGTCMTKESSCTISSKAQGGSDRQYCQLLGRTLVRDNHTNQAKFLILDTGCIATTNTEEIPSAAGSVDCRRHGSSSVLASAVYWLHQFFRNSSGDRHSESGRSNCTVATTSPAEVTYSPMAQAQVLAENKSRLCSDPDYCDAPRGIIKSVDTETSATWVVATVVPHHATGNHALLSGFITKHNDLFVRAADGEPMQVLACGAVVTDAITLPHVWFVPGLTANLVSVSQLTKLDYSVKFGGGACYIKCAADGTVVGKAHLEEGGLYVLDFLKISLAI